MGTALTQEVKAADAEFEKRRQEKGKVPVIEESTEKPRKVKSRIQAQIKMDYELARKSEEEDVARFMEQQRIQKEFTEPEEIVPIPNTESSYQLTDAEIERRRKKKGKFLPLKNQLSNLERLNQELKLRLIWIMSWPGNMKKKM